MKGLAPTTIDTLTDVLINDKWDDYKGKIDTLGLVSGDDPSLNYVQIAATTQFAEDKFTEADYKALVKGMFDGTITVSNDISAAQPSGEKVNVTFEGNIK
jgi:basic membrane protein A